uniref:Uncharacterized protein n=1 Tax=Magallana gigas TaxID=29159 RepID=K1PZ74_MAGGI
MACFIKVLSPASKIQVQGKSSLHGFSHSFCSSRKHVTAERSLSSLFSLRVKKVVQVFEVFNHMPLLSRCTGSSGTISITGEMRNDEWTVIPLQLTDAFCSPSFFMSNGGGMIAVQSSCPGQVTHPALTVSHHSASTHSHARTVLDPSTVTLHRPSIQVFISLHTVRPICLPALLRDLHNGASPYYSLGGASSGYHVNSNGVTNENSPYQSVGGISDSYHVNSNFSVHTTPPTRDYSSKPHPTSENSGARRYFKVKVISTEIGGRSRDIVMTLLSS